jgi:CRISPR-associated protein Cmr6
VQTVLGSLPQGAFNFGLYFQKWFYVDSDNWKCPTGKKRDRVDTGFSLLDNQDASIKFFNGNGVDFERMTYKWDVKTIQEQLQGKHQDLIACAMAFKELGYEEIYYEVPLKTPLVLGLGNEHPTEKGFRFDWTLGIPYIPATGIKGVVRLAYLVNQLNKFDDETEAAAFWADITNKKEKIPLEAQHLFGAGGEQEARRGGVIFLDAYPATLPRLKPEIMNCHYPEYMQGKRGPTEDQQLNPQKFWAIDIKDHNNNPVKFVFRLLIHPDLANNKSYKDGLLQALTSALEEHGLGAKTAIGHGRFDNLFPAQKLQPGPTVDQLQNEFNLLQSEDGTSDSPIVDNNPAKVSQEDTELGPSAKLTQLLERLRVTKPQDAGQVGMFLDGIKNLDSQEEKATLAEEIRNHFNHKMLKKNKRFAELQMALPTPGTDA